MSRKRMLKAINALNPDAHSPLLVLAWVESKQLRGGPVQIHEDLMADLRQVAVDSIEQIDEFETILEYSDATDAVRGEDLVYVPVESFSAESGLLHLLSAVDRIDPIGPAELANHSLSISAIGFGAANDSRTWFVRKSVRQFDATTQIVTRFLNGPLRPIRSNTIHISRDVDFIVGPEGAFVFDPAAYERFVQDPADAAEALSEDLESLAEHVKFSADTLEELKAYGQKGFTLRRRLHALLSREHLSKLTPANIKSELRRLKQNPTNFFKKDVLAFTMDRAQFLFKVLDESAWLGGFSQTLFTASGKRRES